MWLVLGGSFLVAWLVFNLDNGGPSELAERLSVMRQLSIAQATYAEHNGGQFVPPSRWGAIMDPWLALEPDHPMHSTQLRDRVVFFPLRGDGTRDAFDALGLDPAAIPMAYTHPRVGTSGRFEVVFWDGSTRRVEARDFLELLDRFGPPVAVDGVVLAPAGEPVPGP